MLLHQVKKMSVFMVSVFMTPIVPLPNCNSNLYTNPVTKAVTITLLNHTNPNRSTKMAKTFLFKLHTTSVQHIHDTSFIVMSFRQKHCGTQILYCIAHALHFTAL